MKIKSVLFSLLVIGFTAVSCSSDDDNGDSNEPDKEEDQTSEIVGSWQLENLDFGGTFGDVEFSGESTDLNDGDFVVFEESGDFDSNIDEFGAHVNLGPLGESDADISGFFENGNWEINDDEDEVTINGTTYSVEKLDDDTLKLDINELPETVDVKLKDESLADLDLKDILGDADIDGTITFKRM